MFLDRLGALVRRALVDVGVEPGPIGSIRLVRSTRAAHGDFGTPVALRVASGSGRTPMELAEQVRESLGAAAELEQVVEQVTVAPPGFVNVRLTAGALADICQETVAEQDRIEGGKQLLVEPRPPIEALVALHGRLSNLIRWAGSFGMEPTTEVPELMTPPVERSIVCALAEYRSIVAAGKAGLLVAYLSQIADLLYHADLDHRILPKGDEIPTPEHRTRLLLLSAAQVVLGAGLGVLGFRQVERLYG
ncbi:MAG TPA: DALR anticodon-binding domain-containing protein [Actinopolymorphaceae bacterium]